VEPESTDRMRIAVYYAVWATLWAALAGLAVALIHVWFFSGSSTSSERWHALFQGTMTALALAAGQGAVALATGSALARFGRSLHSTVLLGLLIGAFDFAMYVLQMVVPATELGWVPDVLILVAVTAVITALGARAPATP